MTKLLTSGQAARLRGVSVDTIRRWERIGRLRVHTRVGQMRLFTEADVLAA